MNVVGSYGFGVALFLAFWSYFSLIADLGPAWTLDDPIVCGLITGLVTGNVPLGLAVGATLELMSLGLWTYGGATVPDFMTGAIIGTAVGALSKQPLSIAITQGITIAVPVSLFMTQLDILGRATTTVFIHGADRFAAKQDERGITLMHALGNIPWGLSRAIPIFFAIWLGAAPIQSLMTKIPSWLTAGLSTMGTMLPALGFGILLTYLPFKKWWAFFVLGFVLYGYLKIPLIGIAIAALAIVLIYNSVTTKEEAPKKAEEAEKVTEKPMVNSNVTRGDLINAMLRHNFTLQLSWNYERMQALGFCWSIMPILKKVYPNKDDYFAAIKRHLNFYNTNPAIGSPTIFGAACALEEQKQPQAVDDIKVALMGPFAGIGDTIQAILMKPIFAVFAAGMALAGNWFGAVLMAILGFTWFYIMFPGFWLGYNQGLNLVKTAGTEVLNRFSELACMAALVIMGGFIPSILGGVKTPIQFARSLVVEGKTVQQVVSIQSILDSILPYMIPLALVFLVYWLLKRFHWTNLKVLILLVIVALILGALKILG
jgi:mannose/fructose/N-acetylgalactosamine-specific phosphotransferase system component IIC/mannose/fructose/N-acetylgalactosamine-specific phosphotransferase system component IID